MRNTMSVSILALCVCGIATSARAQTAPATVPPADRAPESGPQDEGALADIVVTAERRSENLQRVSIAATALSGEQLDDKAVTRLSDLQFAAPSLSVSDAGLTQSVNIRGVGIASGSPSVVNGVATYIDGVFHAPVLTQGSFYDIGSVEVLRGPQGTLVGSNSTGGAILINTQAPILGRLGGYAQASYGNYDDLNVQGALNLPATDTLAFRAAGNFRHRDSFFTDIGPFRNDADSLREIAGRIGALWEPGSFRVIARAEYIDRKTGGFAYRPISTTPFAAGRVGNLRTLDYNAPTSVEERGFFPSLELRYETAGGVTVRSLSAYTYKGFNNLYDSDATAIANQTSDQFTSERAVSEEINIISPTQGAFDWIVGGYYRWSKIIVDIRQHSASPTDPTDIDSLNRKNQTGFFAQGGYRISPSVKVQLGVRYSTYKVTQAGSVRIGDGLPIFPTGGLIVANLNAAHDDARLTGKINIDWQIDGRNLVYAFVARGYKPGGANSASSEFGPETVWDYELGWKSTLFNSHVRTQFGAFYMDYRDFQFDIIDPTTGQNGVTNIASSSIYGAELQLQAKFGGLSLDGGLAYVHSSLGGLRAVNPRLLPQIGTLGPQCQVGTPSSPPICFDYGPYIGNAAGGRNLFSPEWTYNVGAQYEISLGDRRSLTPRINYAYVAAQFTNLFYSPVTDRLKARGLVSASLNLQVARWNVEAFGSNLSNRKYVSGQTGNNEFYGAPRQYGVRVSTRF